MDDRAVVEEADHYGDPLREQRWLAEGRLVPIGRWARQAQRIAAGIAEVGVDIVPGDLDGERRLVRLQFDGSDEPRYEIGTPIQDATGQTVGRLGTMAYHYELGPIGLGVVDQTIGDRTTVWVNTTAALVEDLSG
ncbi:MAG: hypothetical protein LBE83_02880 [Propionibacteriaceae bacterium]|nr:hypothetical protein [Propionibacteriaceae bacterium]